MMGGSIMEAMSGKACGVMLMMVLLCLLGGRCEGQEQPAQGNFCRESPSLTPSLRGYTDIHCKCNQEIPQASTPAALQIDNLIVDHTGCDVYPALNISWMQLETAIQFRSIIFIEAEIRFLPAMDDAWESVVRNIKFILCTFANISPRAFAGLVNLEELRFSKSYIQNIETYAISNHQNLVTLEFSDTEIRNIHSNAITGLPNLYELAFVRCIINGFGADAVHNLRTPDLPVTPECPELDVRIGGENDVTNNVMDMEGREIESLNNLPLPEFGARLVILHSNISSIAMSAIESDLFAYVIMARNHIIFFGKKALNIELGNQCEFSAVMFIENTIESIQPEAFASITSRAQEPSKSYFLMTNNTLHVARMQGFKLHPSLTLHSALGNKFLCACGNFEWYHHSRRQAAALSGTRQEQLEKALLDTGICADQHSVTAKEYLNTCSEDDYMDEMPSSPAVNPIPPTSTPIPPTSTPISPTSTPASTTVGAATMQKNHLLGMVFGVLITIFLS